VDDVALYAPHSGELEDVTLEDAAVEVRDPSAVWGLIPIAVSLGNCCPNPFNPMTTISYDLPMPTMISLRIFDMSGRLVKELVGGEEYTPGRHEVVWNGRDDVGRQVASGTYFYRLEAGSYSETKRMVLIK